MAFQLHAVDMPFSTVFTKVLWYFEVLVHMSVTFHRGSSSHTAGSSVLLHHGSSNVFSGHVCEKNCAYIPFPYTCMAYLCCGLVYAVRVGSWRERFCYSQYTQIGHQHVYRNVVSGLLVSGKTCYTYCTGVVSVAPWNVGLVHVHFCSAYYIWYRNVSSFIWYALSLMVAFLFHPFATQNF